MKKNMVFLRAAKLNTLLKGCLEKAVCFFSSMAAKQGSDRPLEKMVHGAGTKVHPVRILSRGNFPRGFIFGAATSSYQVEGAVHEGGKGKSIWDEFTEKFPDRIADKSNGNVADDSYHRYNDDIDLLEEMGMDAYRLSISWPRILPDGTKDGGLNQEGVDYYNKLINKLIEKGIEPFVTLFHWDFPQALEDHGGFLKEDIVDQFTYYAEKCFEIFGDRVKHWITINEPWSICTLGYCFGRHAPGRGSSSLNSPVEGDSLTEPYIVAHNIILAHAKAVRLYRQKFKATQQGEVGIVLNSLWFLPLSRSPDDEEAADRSIDFMLGWFLHPLVYGDYPFMMRALVRERLPYFREEEKDMIMNSFDFIGVNYYTTGYSSSVSISPSYTPAASYYDSYSSLTHVRDNIPIGVLQGTWIYVYPDGLKKLLVYIKGRYGNPKVYVTENETQGCVNACAFTGTCDIDYDPNKPNKNKEMLDDQFRIEYHELHLGKLHDAICNENVNVRGYFVWSLMDNFEWDKGYTERYGLAYVNSKTLERTPKKSARWFTDFLKSQEDFVLRKSKE